MLHVLNIHSSAKAKWTEWTACPLSRCPSEITCGNHSKDRQQPWQGIYFGRKGGTERKPLKADFSSWPRRLPLILLLHSGKSTPPTRLKSSEQTIYGILRKISSGNTSWLFTQSEFQTFIPSTELSSVSYFHSTNFTSHLWLAFSTTFASHISHLKVSAF